MQELFNTVHHQENLPFGIKTYITPKTCLNNLAFQSIDKEHHKLKLESRKPNLLAHSPPKNID